MHTVECKSMDAQMENDKSVGPDTPIKIEDDDDSESSDDQIPHVSTVPVSVSAVNSGVYYFPTQAMLPPTSPYSFVAHSPFPQLRSLEKIAHKRKTIEALAQGAMLNAEQPILFEETILAAKTNISVFDNITKVETSRDVLLKENPTIAMNKSSKGTEKDSRNFLRIGGCYSVPQESYRKTPSKGETSLVTACATATCNTPTTMDNNTNAKTISQKTLANSTRVVPPRALAAQLPKVDTNNTITLPTSSLSTKNSLLDLVGNSLNKTLSQKTTTSETLSTVHHIPIRSEASKMAVCLPNTISVDTSRSSLSVAVYIPREINVGSTELGLEDCVNVKDICDKELAKWTADDVAKFVRATDCSEYADAFIDQEIDGKALTLLNQDLLIQWMKLKLGPAMKLYSHILNLKHALHNMP